MALGRKAIPNRGTKMDTRINVTKYKPFAIGTRVSGLTFGGDRKSGVIDEISIEGGWYGITLSSGKKAIIKFETTRVIKQK